jgi:hypothetical protein
MPKQGGLGALVLQQQLIFDEEVRRIILALPAQQALVAAADIDAPADHHRLIVVLADLAQGEQGEAVVCPGGQLVLHTRGALVLAADVALADAQAQVVGRIEGDVGNIEGASADDAVLPAPEALRGCLENGV